MRQSFFDPRVTSSVCGLPKLINNLQALLTSGLVRGIRSGAIILNARTTLSNNREACFKVIWLAKIYRLKITVISAASSVRMLPQELSKEMASDLGQLSNSADHPGAIGGLSCSPYVSLHSSHYNLGASPRVETQLRPISASLTLRHAPNKDIPRSKYIMFVALRLSACSVCHLQRYERYQHLLGRI